MSVDEHIENIGKTVEAIDKTIARLKALALKMMAERDRLDSDLRDCKNELCLLCGRYKTRHNGSCDGCRWLE